MILMDMGDESHQTTKNDNITATKQCITKPTWNLYAIKCSLNIVPLERLKSMA